MESQNFAPQRHQITANAPIQSALEAVLIDDFTKGECIGTARQLLELAIQRKRVIQEHLGEKAHRQHQYDYFVNVPEVTGEETD